MPATLTPCLLRVCRSADPLRRLVILLVLAALVPALRAVDGSALSGRRHYDLAAGDAATTLRHYAGQSGEQVVYVVPRVRGVMTNAVKGDYTARDVIERMVAGTGLVVVRDERTGAITVNRGVAPPPESAANSPPPEPPKTMKKKNPLSVIGAWLALAIAPGHATAADTSVAIAPGAGAVSGRVQNVATGQYLNNARVTVRGTDLVAFTDQTGTYRLPQIPAGHVVLEVFYTGLDTQSVTIDVTPGQPVARDIELTSVARYGEGGVVRLDSFTVATSRETDNQAIAVNEQRFAPNIKNVVSADSLGTVMDGNPGEFLKFLPGVTPEYDYEDGTTVSSVSIRGFAPNMVAVSTDGAQVANTSNATGDSRSFSFNQASMNSVSRIEVTKVPTPATRADSLSGSVNMVSKSAFERKTMQLRYNLNLAANSENFNLRKTPQTTDEKIYKMRPGGSFDLALPINPSFGLLLTATATDRYAKLHYSYKTYNTGGTGTGATVAAPYLQTYRLLDSPRILVRESAGFKADWRVTRYGVLSVGANVSHFQSTRIASEFTADAGTNATPTPATGTPFSYGPDYTIGATGRGSVTLGSATSTHIITDATAGDVRYRYDNGTWKVTLSADKSRAEGGYHDISKGHFRQMGISLRNPARLVFQGINPTRPATLQIFDNNNQPVDLYDIRNYQLNTVNSTPRNTLEDFDAGTVDIGRTIPFLPFPASWQIGAQQRTQTRDIRRQNENWTYNGINGDRSPAPFLTPVYFGQYNYYGFRGVPEVSPIKAWDAYQANLALFTKTAAQLVTEETFRINNSLYFKEGVRAGYAQTEFSLLQSRLKVLTGVRYEQTDTQGLGPVVDPAAVWQRNADGSFARDAAGLRIRRADAGAAGSLQELKLTTREREFHAEQTYDGYYPSLHLNYNFAENLIGRAAYAKTYGRPNLTNILPSAQVSEADLDQAQLGDPNVVKGTITVTNTGLRPWSADNYDLSVEYYTKNGGVISAGAFVKDLKDFFVNSVSIATAADAEALGLDARYAGWRITTTRNGGSARVAGVELNLTQSLRELGAWGRNVNVFVNGTKLHLEGESEAAFNAFTPEGLNWGFSYSPKRATFMAKWNYRGKRRLGSLTNGAYEYDDRRLMLDLNFDYQVGKRIQLYASAQNVFNSRAVTMRYGPTTPDYAKAYLTGAFGVGITMGVKGSF